MTEFGKTLREARERKGLTTSQIAEMTHLLPQIVEDMENEDFHRISAPIYGRGFVKLYCEAVDLEPKPLVDEFMAILNGERTPSIKMKTVELPPEPSEPAPPPPPVYTQPELGDATAPSRPEAVEVTRQETPPAPAPRQYHPDYARAALPLPPNLGRLAILAGGALVVLALLIWGGRALYRASMTVPGEEPAAETDQKVEKQDKKDASPKVEVKETKVPAPQTKAQRTPKTVPALYID